MQEHRDIEEDIVRLLAFRYGDGTVYLLSGGPRHLLRMSIELGFVSLDGFITAKGREL